MPSLTGSLSRADYFIRVLLIWRHEQCSQSYIQDFRLFRALVGSAVPVHFDVLPFAASPALCDCTGSRKCWLNPLNTRFSCGLHMQQELNASCAHQFYYLCSEKMHSRSDSHGWAVPFVCSHFTLYRILYFAKTTRFWTDTEVHMLLTEIQAQFTVQMGQLPLFFDSKHRAGEGHPVSTAGSEPAAQPKSATFLGVAA